MTGFGKASVEIENQILKVEIKSLNSKQFDASVKTPSKWRELELEIRNILLESVIKGKVDCCITIENNKKFLNPIVSLSIFVSSGIKKANTANITNNIIIVYAPVDDTLASYWVYCSSKNDNEKNKQNSHLSTSSAFGSKSVC